MTDLRKQKTSDTTISNQDKTVTANGEYTADENYTGLGTVTVSVPPTPQENFFNLGATIDSNGIASNFTGSDSTHVTWGGILAKFNQNYFTDRFTTFQLAFTTPEEIPEWFVPCGTPTPNKVWGGNGGDYDLIINAHAAEDKLYFFGLGFNNVETSVNFLPNTDYIIRITRSTFDNGIFISSDGGTTFTKLYSSIPNDFTNMRNTQFGFYAGYNNNIARSFDGTIDLKNTGFLNLNTNEKYMLLQ